MVGTKLWGAFLWFAMALNVFSLVLNIMAGSLMAVVSVLCIMLLVWCLIIHNEAKRGLF